MMDERGLSRREGGRLEPVVRVSEGGLVVVDKPWGMVSAGPAKWIYGEAEPRDSVELWLGRTLGRRVWAVHQLDRMTSGLNVFVTSARAVARWADALKVPGSKEYSALTHVLPGQNVNVGDVLVVEEWLGVRRETGSGKTFPAVVPASDPSAKAAQSRVEIVARAGAFARVRVVPLTGRTHQVRLHLASVGMPLIGEPLHRDPPCTLHPRHALHASALTLEGRRIESNLPLDLEVLATKLGLLAGPLSAPS